MPIQKLHSRLPPLPPPLDLQEEVAEECNKYGIVESCKVDKQSSPSGLVYMTFSDVDGATKAANNLHGRYFAQRFITVKYIDPKDAQPIVRE